MNILLTRDYKDSLYLKEVLGKGFIEPQIKINHFDIEIPEDKILISTSKHATSKQIISLNKEITNSSELLTKLLSLDKNSEYLYLRGKNITIDIEKIMQEHGFNISSLITYEAQKIDNFSDAFLEFIKSEDFQIVTLFSVRTAKIFLDKLNIHKIKNKFKNTNFICFSKNIGDIVSNKGYKRVIYPNKPLLNEFVKLIKETANEKNL